MNTAPEYVVGYQTGTSVGYTIDFLTSATDPVCPVASKRNAGQTVDLFQIKDENGGVLARIDYLGRVAAPALIFSAQQTPASATASGVAGTVVYDSNYIYTCVATDTWKRAALSTW